MPVLRNGSGLARETKVQWIVPYLKLVSSPDLANSMLKGTAIPSMYLIYTPADPRPVKTRVNLQFSAYPVGSATFWKSLDRCCQDTAASRTLLEVTRALP